MALLRKILGGALKGAGEGLERKGQYQQAMSGMQLRHAYRMREIGAQASIQKGLQDDRQEHQSSERGKDREHQEGMQEGRFDQQDKLASQDRESREKIAQQQEEGRDRRHKELLGVRNEELERRYKLDEKRIENEEKRLEISRVDSEYRKSYYDFMTERQKKILSQKPKKEITMEKVYSMAKEFSKQADKVDPATLTETKGGVDWEMVDTIMDQYQKTGKLPWDNLISPERIMHLWRIGKEQDPSLDFEGVKSKLMGAGRIIPESVYMRLKDMPDFQFLNGE